ncbi:MAG: VWA domain-containing protein [Acidimicrobiia bacterium]|nr:VWA domain-containing protein [Acidimicrobiia bacterium]
MQPTIRLNHNLLAVESEHTVHAMVELTAPEAPDQDRRAALKLALVIDRSGSMAGDKLAVTKACAAYLVRRLTPPDELAIVAYDDAVDLVAPLAPVHTENLLSAIAAIGPGGSTNLSGGWLKGLEVLKVPGEASADDTTRRVLLLTDGQANAGITEPAALVSMATSARGAGVGTTTIGFGDHFAEELLTDMGDAGGGNAHFAPTPDAAPAIFAEEFEGLASVVAQNVSIEIRPGDDVDLVEVLNHYPATPVAGGVQLALGDAYGGEHRSVVFALHVPALAQLGMAKVADVVLRYVGVGDQIAAHELTLPLMVNVVSADEAASAQADHAVVEEVVVLEAAKARDEARRLADEGDFEGGQTLLRASAHQLRQSATDSAKADELLAEADMLDGTGGLLASATYDATTRKRLHYDAYRARRRREPGP